MLHKEKTLQIINWVLQERAEPSWENDPVQRFDEDRLRAAVQGTKPFTTQERQEMLRSPAARHKLRFIAEVIRAERLLAWKEDGVVNEFGLQAAAGGGSEPVSIGNSDFTLSLLPLDENGEEWMLHLKLSPRVLRSLQGHSVKICDDEGTTWLEGNPDSEGELSKPWKLEGSPVDRLTGRRLFVEPK